MKNLCRKMLALLLAGAYAFTLTACSNSTGNKQTKQEEAAVQLSKVGTYPIAEKPLAMTMVRLSMPNVVDFASNDFSKFIAQKTNINWTYQTVNMDTADEQINLMMSKKPLPDAFLFSTPKVSKYGVSEGLLLPLENLIKENMPNFMAYVKEKPELWSQITQADGHIYGLPTINDCYHCKYRNKMWVNMRHLRELNLQVPTTTEDLRQVMQAYKKAHPQGIPMSGSIDGWGHQFYDWITNAFILDPGVQVGKLVISPDKKIESIAVKKEYRAALRYMNSLYKEGLIDDSAFTQTADNYRKLMNNEGEPVLFAPFGTISDAYDANSKPQAYADYRVMAPVKGPEGKQHATYFRYDGIAENKFVLTKDCKNPAAALRWIDYFYTLEGYLSMQFGADKDKDWRLNPTDKKGLDGSKALYEIINQYSSDPQNHDWQDVGLNFATEKVRFGQATDNSVDIKSAAGLEKLLYTETKEKCEPYAQNPKTDYDVLPVLKFTAAETDQLNQITVDVKKYLEENRAAFIRGVQNPDDDQAWDNYVKGFEAVGLPTLIKLSQTAYDRTIKK